MLEGGEANGNTDKHKTLLEGIVVDWARIEFKETWDPEASLKTICALEATGSPKPIFETDDERLSFVSTVFIHSAFLEANETENAILQYFKRYPHNTILKLYDDINLSRSRATRAIKNLKARKLLERHGSDRKGEWIVKTKSFNR